MISTSVKPRKGLNLHYIYRMKHKLKDLVEKPSKASVEVVQYLESTPEYSEIKDLVPKALLKKYKTTENMYLINKNTAKEIASSLRNHMNVNDPIIEVNPGFGFLSQELLLNIQHLYMFESTNYFSQFIGELQTKYPGKITYKTADFFSMWKLAFQDKMDQGNRIKDLLGNLFTADNERIVKIVGAMPGLSFVKHLIYTIIFNNSNNQLGRPDMFITMPIHHYDFLTGNQVQSSKYKSIPALFQLLFDCKEITKVPKIHYLPWMQNSVAKKASVMDEYCLYLVNITRKEKLPCSNDHLPLLWYFFKPHMIPNSARVIPMLEQWIPGCGVWLITGQDPPDTNKALGPGDDDEKLPHMTIFTQFGDLSLRQKITVFKKFISWPEFEQCPFRVTMETNLPKVITALDSDDKFNKVVPIDEDEQSDTESTS